MLNSITTAPFFGPSAFYLNEITAFFSYPLPTPWFRERPCLLLSLLALCQGPEEFLYPPFIPRVKSIQGYHSAAKEDGEKRPLLSCWELWWPETGVAGVTERSGLSLGDHAGVMSRQVCTDTFSWLFPRWARCRNLLAIAHSTNAAPHYFPCRWIHNVHWIQIACAWACSVQLTVAVFHCLSTNQPGLKSREADIWHKILFVILSIFFNPQSALTESGF